ncbi:MAG: magnesium transporter [Rhodopirellula sp.]|nr:magnesium transporter [Rhodopirellula sp.]
MTNTLYLPELREMLAENNAAELREFCEALHPARTAEFMEGLSAPEMWAVLRHADPQLRVQIFNFLDYEKQIEILQDADRAEIAQLVSDLPPDDRVDLLEEVNPEVVAELMPLLPVEERRDIQRLSSFPEDSAGAIMTTEFARLSENLSVRQALDEIGRQAEDLETIYYLYVVDTEDHLRGLVSARQLVSKIGKPDTKIGDIMERDLVTVNVLDDQEQVADKVAHYDLLAIPVVDDEWRLVGIITHDDVIDVMREEAEEDAYHRGAVHPLEKSYLETRLVTLTWKRGIWLAVLFFAALLTAVTLEHHEAVIAGIPWLVLFLPLIVSTGGNSGNQSATLIITALSAGDVRVNDWARIVRREFLMGLMLGGSLAAVGYLCALSVAPGYYDATVIPITILLVVVCGTLTGSLLPLLFRRMGLDPAMMSNPFVAGLIDLLGIIIYMNVSLLML